MASIVSGKILLKDNFSTLFSGSHGVSVGVKAADLDIVSELGSKSPGVRGTASQEFMQKWQQSHVFLFHPFLIHKIVLG